MPHGVAANTLGLFASVNISDMALDLTGVRAKLQRSQEHFQTLKEEMRSWMDRHPYSVLQKVNGDGSRYSLILRVDELPPLQRWTLIFADCINNMRCALDYLVYAIAVHEAAPNPPSNEKDLLFPIVDSRANFDKAVTDQRRLGKISDSVRTAIEKFQPYNRPHPELPPLLAVLRELNNADKHRLLRLVFGAVQGGELTLVGNSEVAPNVVAAAHVAEVEDGTEIFAFTCDPPTLGMHFDRGAKISVIIAIWHGKREPSEPDFTGRSDILSVLALLSDEIREVIYTVSGKAI